MARRSRRCPTISRSRRRSTLSLDEDVLATVMRTPGHDLELAAGWLVVESGVRQAQDIARMRECA